MAYKKRGRSTVNLGFEIEYRKKLKALVDGMIDDIKKRVREAAKEHPLQSRRANDWTFPSWFIVEIMKAIRMEWYPLFDKLSKEVAPLMYDAADKRTQKQIVMKLKEYGFAISYHLTDEQKRALWKLTRDNMAVSKTIPQFIAGRAQAAIMSAYYRGGDLEGLTERLDTIGGLGRDKAALVARDQLNRVTQQMAIANAKAYGVTKGRWIHVPGLYSSRRTHVKFNGQTFNLDEGIYDPDVGMRVKPGELKYCNCVFEILAPGFED